MGGTVNSKTVLDAHIKQKKVKSVLERLKDLETANAKQAEEIAMLNINHAFAMMEKVGRDHREQSNKLAVQFVSSQVMIRIADAQFLTGALFLANNEYNGILGVKDAEKMLDIDLLSLLLIAAPALGPIASRLKDMAEKGGKFEKIIAHIGNNANDIYGATIAQNAGDADYSSLNKASSANNVIKHYLSEAYKQIGSAMVFQNFLIPRIIEENMTLEETKDWWVDNDLPIIDVQNIRQYFHFINKNKLDLAANVLLYEMLKNYASKWCRYIAGTTMISSIGTKHIKELPNKPELLFKDGEGWGDFIGMSGGTREAIYKRFSSWSGSPQQPPIKDYRDMIKHWKVPIDIE